MRTHRRGLLGRAAAVAAGVVGFGAVASVGARPRTPEPRLEDRPEAGTIELLGRDWHLTSSDLRRGELPSAGDRMAMYGELTDRDGGKVGEFYSSCFCVGSPFGPTDYAAANLEMHTFNLAGGSILGMGSATAGDNVYAVVGGTGKYAGAAGSYVARQQPSELGGDGTAAFVLTLTK